MEQSVQNMVSIHDALSKLKTLKISGTILEIVEGRDADSNVFVLELDNPIPRVSSSLEYDVDGVKQKLSIEDVYTIKIHQSSLPKTFVCDAENGLEGASFTYEGEELKKDISSIGEPWLVSKTFRELSKEGLKQRSDEKAKQRASKFRAAVTTS